jgi:hypothetical protein
MSTQPGLVLLANILFLTGCLSGPKKAIVELQDSKKRPGQLEELSLPMQPLPPQYETIATETATATV